jgi:hypothetical protein
METDEMRDGKGDRAIGRKAQSDDRNGDRMGIESKEDRLIEMVIE